MGIVKWTKNEIINLIEQKNYLLIDLVKYNGVNSTITIKCKNENHNPYTINFNGFKNGSRCKECQYELLREKFAFTYDTVKLAIEKRGYNLLSPKYVNANQVIEMECPVGHRVKMTYGNFYKGHECKSCIGNKKYSLSDIREYVKADNYEVLSNEYLGSNEPLELICAKGHIYRTKFSTFQQGHRCPKCKSSKGEKVIFDILDRLGIEHKRQVTFKGLTGVNQGLLSYDFYIKSMNLLIEYQGEFHDGTAEIQTKEEFEIQKIHDDKKRKYAQNKNIKLLEIWYWDFHNIEEILKNNLTRINFND